MQDIEGFLLLAVIVAIVLYRRKVKNDNIAALKAKYAHALKGHDKGAALAAGRAYYATLRKDRKLTIYDEQAINNDISTMDTVRVSITHTEHTTFTNGK